MALSQNAARQPNYYGQGCIGRATRSQPSVVDTLNTTLGILAGSQKLIVQRGAYTTNKLIQSASRKTKLVLLY